MITSDVLQVCRKGVPKECWTKEEGLNIFAGAYSGKNQLLRFTERACGVHRCKRKQAGIKWRRASVQYAVKQSNTKDLSSPTLRRFEPLWPQNCHTARHAQAVGLHACMHADAVGPAVPEAEPVRWSFTVLCPLWRHGSVREFINHWSSLLRKFPLPSLFGQPPPPPSSSQSLFISFSLSLSLSLSHQFFSRSLLFPLAMAYCNAGSTGFCTTTSRSQVHTVFPLEWCKARPGPSAFFFHTTVGTQPTGYPLRNNNTLQRWTKLARVKKISSRWRVRQSGENHVARWSLVRAVGQGMSRLLVVVAITLEVWDHQSLRQAVGHSRRRETNNEKKKRQKAYSTGYSQAVTHPSTNPAQRCLTSVIGREPVFSPWYGRRHLRWSKTSIFVAASASEVFPLGMFGSCFQSALCVRKKKKMDLISYRSELTKELIGFNGCTDVVIRPGPPAGQNTQKKHKTLRLSAAKSYGSFFFFSSFIINMPILNSNAQSDRDLVLQYM